MTKLFDRGQLKPSGWLARQLRIQADGLSGNLDKIWPDVRDSAWIGGDREGWERVPYWLDGFIPLAFLLEDEDLIARARKYVDGILRRQQPDGWICPCGEEERPTYDLWAALLIGKVLALYCDFTGDRKAERGLYRAMFSLYTELTEKKVSLFGWGEYRWFEGIIPLLHLKKKHPKEKWITELGILLRDQGADYPSFTENWKEYKNTWTFRTHIVNIGMMFKYEAVTCALLGEKETNKAEELWNILDRYNGTATGIFTGDECLAGVANNRGTELCAVAELMYSCECLYSLTGRTVWLDRLEKLAFNALPATLSEDMWTHQYDQSVNQIACLRFPGRTFFGTNGTEASCFGLEPNFGCCTANFNQAWPKLAMSVFQRSRGGVVCAVMLPAVLDTVLYGTRVKITSDTLYPFRHSCRFTVETESPVTFELKIRIPTWAKSVTVNGASVVKSPYVAVKKEWSGSETLEISLTDTPHLVRRPGSLRVVEYGPLLFSLPIETEWKPYEYEANGVERKFPYCDYELIPHSEWRYGLASETFEVCEREMGEIPFSASEPPLVLKTKLARVDWRFAEGHDWIPDKKPVSSKAISEPEEHELIPYGAAKLRMTEMPMTR